MFPGATISYATGFWTAGTFAGHRTTEANAASTPVTLSPFDMQRNVKPSDLPVQYMRGDFN